jgi:hypothetical protein
MLKEVVWEMIWSKYVSNVFHIHCSFWITFLLLYHFVLLQSFNGGSAQKFMEVQIAQLSDLNSSAGKKNSGNNENA